MIKPIYSCAAAILGILAGAALFRTHAMRAGPGSATATRSVALQEAIAERKIHLPENYGKLPLSFEANKGQTDGRVKFLSRGRGYGLFLTSSEAVLTLHHVQGPKVHPRLRRPDPESQSMSVLRLKLVGANPAIDVTGLEELPGKSNYFIGNDPEAWRTDVPNFAKLQYKDVYPGVDLIYYGNQRQLEYDWAVGPGADLSAIQFAIDGAHQIRIDSQGDLVIQTEDGEVRFQKPVVYQQQFTVDSPQSTASNEIRNSEKFETRHSSLTTRRLLEGWYVLRGKGCVGFEVASYDQSKPLIIDPVLVYSTYLGGSGNDEGIGITVDSAGNAYLTGSTKSTDFPTASPLQPAFGGGVRNAFVTKLNATGNALVYSTYFGGSGDDFGLGIAVDSAGNAYVTGSTSSTNFPTASPIQAAFGGGTQDAFVTKLNAVGSALVYSTYLGGSGDEQARGIAVDSAGNAYVTGSTSSSNFPTASPIQAAFGGGTQDAFVTKLNAVGSAFVYSTYLGGGGDDRSVGVAADSAGNAYVTGFTGSTNFPTASPIQVAFGGGVYDAFVTKLNAAGSAPVYSTYLGGSDQDLGGSIAVDSAGNAYVTGNTLSTNFPTVNPFQATNHGQLDAFVAKLNSAGSALVYSTYLGGVVDDFGGSIAVDSAGNAYLTGSTKSTNFPTASPLEATHGAASANAFVTKLNAAGGALIYSTYLGGNGVQNADGALGIAVDSAGNAYVTGLSGSIDFPTVNAIQPVFGGGLTDAFVAKISPANLPGASLAPAGLTFASQLLATASSVQTVMLLDAGSAALNISNIAATGDFAETHACGISLAGGANCIISVTFAPTALGTRTGSLTVTDNAAGSPHTVSLSGTGSDFSLAAATGANCPSGGNCSTSAIITAGQTATYNLEVSPVNGFSGTLSLTCSGAPGASTCAPSPASVPPNGSSSYAFAVTVSNTANAIALPSPTTPGAPGFPWLCGALLFLAGMAVLLFVRSTYHTGRQTWRLLPGLAMLLFVLLSFNGCGGGGGGGRPPTNATLTITGSSGSVKHTLNLSLTINH